MGVIRKSEFGPFDRGDVRYEDFALVDLVEQSRRDVGPARYTLGVPDRLVAARQGRDRGSGFLVDLSSAHRITPRVSRRVGFATSRKTVLIGWPSAHRSPDSSRKRRLRRRIVLVVSRQIIMTARTVPSTADGPEHEGQERPDTPPIKRVEDARTSPPKPRRATLLRSPLLSVPCPPPYGWAARDPLGHKQQSRSGLL